VIVDDLTNGDYQAVLKINETAKLVLKFVVNNK
jgi:hypothetical protein